MTDVDDLWDWRDEGEPCEEPPWNCWDCRDTGSTPGSRYCRSCNPSPRHRRRAPYLERRRRERFDRDVAAGRIVLSGEAPF